jgi:hypothetical protein
MHELVDGNTITHDAVGTYGQRDRSIPIGERKLFASLHLSDRHQQASGNYLGIGKRTVYVG